VSVQLPQLTLQQKWETAESNLLYFVICGITYAKTHGESAEDFGTWAGQVAAPLWEEDRDKRARGLVEGIAYNKQQFQGFEMEILAESARTIEARMKGFGEDSIRRRPRHEITVDEYIQFFDKKWIAIAEYLGLEYSQRVEGEWVIFTVTDRAQG
jgi:hypothetical protein